MSIYQIGQIANGSVSTPPAGKYNIFLDTDGKWKSKDSSNVVVVLNNNNITLTDLLKGAKSTPIASAATTDLSTATGNYVQITGTTTITSFGTQVAGTLMAVVFASALTITYNATSLILPTNSNIITQAGDTALFESEGSGNWRCINYQRRDGSALISNPIPPYNTDQYTAGGVTAIGTTSYTHTYPGLTIGKKYMITIQSFVSKTGGAITTDVSSGITGASTAWGALTTVGRQNYAVATGEIYVFACWIMVTATATTIAITINGTFTGSGTPTFYDIATTIELKS